MMNLNKKIEEDIKRIKESIPEIEELAKEDIKKFEGETEKIKELAKKDKERILKDFFGSETQK